MQRRHTGANTLTQWIVASSMVALVVIEIISLVENLH